MVSTSTEPQPTTPRASQQAFDDILWYVETREDRYDVPVCTILWDPR